MIYILVALEDEFRFPDIDYNKYAVCYTGVGKINAAFFATKCGMQDNCERIINYGTAGALNTNLIGKLHKVGTVYQRDMDTRPLTPLGTTPYDAVGSAELKINNSSVTLSTGDNFVTNMPEIVTDLVDMEAYAIAKVCCKFNIPFTCMKYASDFADSNAADHWQENVANGKELFLDWLNKN